MAAADGLASACVSGQVYYFSFSQIVVVVWCVCVLL